VLARQDGRWSRSVVFFFADAVRGRFQAVPVIIDTPADYVRNRTMCLMAQPKVTKYWDL
jgi:hypothetical protein